MFPKSDRNQWIAPIQGRLLEHYPEQIALKESVDGDLRLPIGSGLRRRAWHRSGSMAGTATVGRSAAAVPPAGAEGRVRHGGTTEIVAYHHRFSPVVTELTYRNAGHRLLDEHEREDLLADSGRVTL